MIQRLTSEAMFPAGSLRLRVLRNTRHAECARHRHEFHELGQATGRTPLDYVIRTRIARAALRLCRERIPVTEIALDCGFSDPNYFARQFRRVTGQSPRAHRRASFRW